MTKLGHQAKADIAEGQAGNCPATLRYQSCHHVCVSVSVAWGSVCVAA